jgi:hypothetical protein
MSKYFISVTGAGVYGAAIVSNVCLLMLWSARSLMSLVPLNAVKYQVVYVLAAS